MTKQEPIPNQIWNKIKNIQVSLYALPAKPLSEYLTPKLDIPFEVLYVKPANPDGNIMSVLENAIGPNFSVQTFENGWIEIKELAPKPEL